jgi:mono/diheme cytochrome c family protein/peroxiredoxin
MNRHPGNTVLLVLGAVLSILYCGCSSKKSSEPKAADGKTVYMNNCAGCHGAEGEGDGTKSSLFEKDQVKLTKETWKHGRTPEEVRKVVVEGVGSMPKTTGLSREEVDAVVQYVLKFAITEKPKKTSARDSDGLLRAAGLIPQVPVPAPAVQLRDLKNQPAELATAGSRLTLAYLWSAGCVKCVAEMPELARLAQSYEKQGLRVVSVCVDAEDAEEVPASARKAGLPLHLDPGGKARRMFDVQMSPTVVLLDGDGRVVARGHDFHPGARESRALFDSLLAR